MTTSKATEATYVDEVEEARPKLQQLLDDIKAEATIELQKAGVDLHAVTARLKGRRSLISKLRKKSYADPWNDVMDLLAIRVITYYEDHVEAGVAAIKAKFGWQPDQSVDKRKSLGTREFGYRSVHIISPTPQALTSLLDCKTPKFFEVQIRSILEHVWAEIDHEVVYKSGIDFPELTKRRFGALAGSLEILDREFVHVRKVQHELVDHYRQEYVAGKRGNEELDTARMIGALQSKAPKAQGWERSGSEVFDFQNARVFVEALADAGLTTWNALRNTLDTPKHRDAREAFAAAAGIAPDDVGHRALVAIAVGITSAETLERFPELGDGDVQAAIAAATTAVAATTAPAGARKGAKVDKLLKNVLEKAKSAKAAPLVKKEPLKTPSKKAPAKKAAPARKSAEKSTK